MNKRLFAIINPVVKFVLRSPFHGLMSRNTVLLEFTGRKSGNTYCTPVSYHMTDGLVHCLTGKENLWWRNLDGAEAVELTLQGRKITGKPTVLPSGTVDVQNALHNLLVVSPRDASYSGVGFDADGQPNAADIVEASKNLVLITIATSIS